MIAFVLCAVVYVKMVKREVCRTLGLKSIIPVVLGFIAPFIMLALMIGFRIAVISIAGQEFALRIPNLVLHSLAKAFFGAGFPEELTKLVLALIAVAIVRPKNVYTYALMFIGVGFGFTALEEIVYGGGNDLMSLVRLPGFALHMIFGMVMGLNLGLAKFNRIHKSGPAFGLVLSGLILPVLWHTVYDAASVENAGILSEDDMVVAVSIIAFVVVEVLSVVYQFILLGRFRKKSSEYSKMEF